MPCVAIKSFGDLAVVATVVFVGLVGVWLLMWPVISFMLKMVDMIQLPEEKDLTEYKTLLDIWTDTTGYINLITDSVTCKEYLERKKRFDKYKKIIYPKAFKFIKKDSNGLLGKANTAKLMSIKMFTFLFNFW